MIRNRSLIPRICESFYAENLTSALESIERVQYMGELRFDLSRLEVNDLNIIRNSFPKKPLIFTFRGNSESALERLKVYERAVEQKFEFIDLDITTDPEIISRLKPLLKTTTCKLIISYHNYTETPDFPTLRAILQEISQLNPDHIKIVTIAHHANDLESLKNLQSLIPSSLCFSMGEFAAQSRLQSLYGGAPFTYIALQANKQTAPGQLDFKEFQKLYLEFRGGKELKLAVLGNPIAHSKSPILFHEFFTKHAIDGIYEKIELDDIQEFLELKPYYDGFNITAPFKKTIMAYVDGLTQEAEQIGAVNTIYKEHEKWIGDNTDFSGILKSLKPFLSHPDDNTCLIIGAGGAASAAAFAMQQKGIATTIINRTPSKSLELAQKFGHKTVSQPNLSNFRIIINTIPEPFSLVNKYELNTSHVVLDAIYSDSPFAKAGIETGFHLINGEKWLYEQALQAFEKFKNSILQ